MFELRKSFERGFANHGWLKARHSFSFASYYDPEQMGFRDLRVINQDIVAPSTGFGTHPHNDMEILTYIVSGAIRHKDSMGNDYVIEAGEIQTMSAGTGVRHSEFNASEKDHLELLQIWILSDKAGHEPSYDQKKFSREDKLNQFKLVAGSYSDTAPLKIHQDVKMFASILEEKKQLDYKLGPDRYGWLQLVRGDLSVVITKNEDSRQVTLEPGDGIKLDQGTMITVNALSEAEFIFFDLN